MPSLLPRLLLALVLVINGVGGVLAGIRGLDAPGGAPATAAPRGHAAMAPASSLAMGDCHAAGATADAAVAAAVAAPDMPAHGHCCLDACHCVCTLQAQVPVLLPAPLPRGTVTGLLSLPGWSAPDPALLLRPPIA